MTSQPDPGESRITDATASLVEIASAFTAAQLEAILIGSAGAALQGAPVTTLDFDFFYRASPANEAKLRKIAQILGAQISQPFPTIFSVYRILRPSTQLQIDLTSQIHGARSFNSMRNKAVSLDIGGQTILVAALADMIKSEREANRQQDAAVLHVLQRTLEEQQIAQANQARTGPRSHAPGE